MDRIKNVLNFKKPSRIIFVVALVVVIVLSVGFAVNRATVEPLIEMQQNGSALSVCCP